MGHACMCYQVIKSPLQNIYYRSRSVYKQSPLSGAVTSQITNNLTSRIANILTTMSPLLFSVCCILVSFCLLDSAHAQCHCSTGAAGAGVGYVTDNSGSASCLSCYEEFISVHIQIDDEDFELLIIPNYYISSMFSSPDLDDSTRRRQLTTTISDGSNSSVYSEESYVGKCKYCSLYKNSYSTKERVTIYQNGSFVDFCDNNSEGFFCSQCKEGYYHNLGTVCEKCDNLGGQWILYLLSQFVPMTIWFGILLYFDLSIITGPLNAVLFTAQLLSSTMDIDQDEIPVVNITGSTDGAYALTATYKLIYGITNLEFFSPFVNDICLFRTQSYLYNFIPQYLVAFYPIVLIIIGSLVFNAFKRYYNKNGKKFLEINKYVCGIIPSNRLNRPPKKVFASIALLVYIKFTWLCTLLLTPAYLYDYKGQKAKTVFTFDPSVSFFEGSSVPYIVLGIICFVFISILPGIYLLIRQEKVVMLLKKVLMAPFLLDNEPPSTVADIESSERKEKKLARWRKWVVAHLQYPDSSTVNDRFIPAVYLVMRILLLMAYLLIDDIMHRLLLYQVILVFGALMFLIVKPYQKPSDDLPRCVRYDNNKLDSCILLVLAFINTISMYQVYRSARGLSLSVSAFAVQYILIFVPLVWFLYYAINHVCMNFIRVNGKLYFWSKKSDPTQSLWQFFNRNTVVVLTGTSRETTV